MAEAIPDDWRRNWALSATVGRLAATDPPDSALIEQAVALAETIPHATDYSETLASIAQRLIAPGYPVDIARRQLMVCMGILAENADRLLTAWRKNAEQKKQSANLDQAKNVATVAGTFLRAFAGL